MRPQNQNAEQFAVGNPFLTFRLNRADELKESGDYRYRLYTGTHKLLIKDPYIDPVTGKWVYAWFVLRGHQIVTTAPEYDLCEGEADTFIAAFRAGIKHLDMPRLYVVKGEQLCKL
jgi:hypothetical protein